MSIPLRTVQSFAGVIPSDAANRELSSDTLTTRSTNRVAARLERRYGRRTVVRDLYLLLAINS